MQGATVTVQIDAPPERVYELVSDVTRMAEWSPVNYRCEWVEGSEPREGAKFRGYNKQGLMRWNRECVVTKAEPGREFAFSTYYNEHESTRWRYVFEPADGGTKVTESFDPVWAPPLVRITEKFMGKKMEADSRRNIETSLSRLKAAAEAQQQSA